VPSLVLDQPADGNALVPTPLLFTSGEQKLNRKGTYRRPLDVIWVNTKE
jgi:hypothetical protein